MSPDLYRFEANTLSNKHACCAFKSVTRLDLIVISRKRKCAFTYVKCSDYYCTFQMPDKKPLHLRTQISRSVGLVPIIHVRVEWAGQAMRVSMHNCLGTRIYVIPFGFYVSESSVLL